MTTQRHPPTTRHIRARLRIRHLELLLVLDEVRSFHKAGARMGMTQPAASKLLQEIEEMFGVQLFLRSRRGITPTVFGVALLRKAALLLSDLDSARDEIESLTQGATGRIRVGVLQVAIPVLLPRAFARLQADFPRISLLLQEGTNESMLAALAKGELDCVLGRVSEESLPDAILWEVLYQEPVCIAARHGHPLSRLKRITPAMLAQHAWILPPKGAPLRPTIERYFREQGVTPPVAAIDSVSVLANVMLMRDTDLLAAMPLAVAQHYAEMNLLTILSARPDWTLPPVGIATRADVPASPVLEAFRATLFATASELDAQRPARRH
ncbi:LysR family transcriptional regulator [Cupriavidus necator]